MPFKYGLEKYDTVIIKISLILRQSDKIQYNKINSEKTDSLWSIELIKYANCNLFFLFYLISFEWLMN